jgi:NTE family protein
MSNFSISDIEKRQSETVLVMQGGGSLGAYECGVYKTLSKHGIKFDILSGTSIGAINAGIIAGANDNNGKEPAMTLEDFWLDVAEKDTPPIKLDKERAIVAATYAGMYGNRKVFQPIWNVTNPYYYWYNPLLSNKPYLFNLDPLKKTLKQYIDFNKLNDRSRSPRLIVTCTDIKQSSPVVFDNRNTRITPEELVAGASFPFYGIEWAEVDGKYLWDGALLSNTPLREVIDASPKYDKRVYMVSLFPHYQEELPQTMLDSWHRARDIMHTDRTDNSVRMSKVISRYLALMKEMHDIISNVDLDEKMRDKFIKLKSEYCKLAEERGTIIEEMIKIERSEDVHFLFEDADFSIITIKKLIQQGEIDAENTLTARTKKSKESRIQK